MSFITWQPRRLMAADGTGGGSADAGTATEPVTTQPAESGEGEPGGTKPTTLTQADVDRIINETIAKERKRAEKAVKEARTEAERLARMSDEERAGAEEKARLEALERREAEIARRELRAQAIEDLGKRELPASLADALVYTDADACKASLDAVEKAVRAAVDDMVKKRIAGTPPKAGTGAGADTSKPSQGAILGQQAAESVKKANEARDKLFKNKGVF